MANPTLDEEAIFNTARRIQTSDDRGRYVAQACGADRDLHARIEALLRVHDEDRSFLEPPTQWPQAGAAPRGEGPGTVIGPYKLLEPLGEGGMGTVFLAEQAQPVRRQVALKIITPGMDTAQVVARFEAERQALALMDHPNIAKVLDAGTVGQDSDPVPPPAARIGILSHTGSRPYFVMELVQGVPLTQYCDEHRLTPHERLELFVPVCQGVQHAHQKGIIHRDLKPSNVLVAQYDGKPVPKIIDFGVAKATGQKLTERTLVTLYLERGRHHAAEPLLREAVETARKKPGLSDVETRLSFNKLINVYSKQGQPHLAEPLLRELTAYFQEEYGPGSSQHARHLARLAQSLLEQKKYADAEKLLLQGYGVLQQRAAKFPKESTVPLTEALEHLVHLYGAWGKPDQMDEWKKRLAEHRAKPKP